jgi:hypothetical protein
MSDHKEHVPKILDSKFNRQRGQADIKTNCGNDGYIFNLRVANGTVNSGSQSQIHHVLPVTTLQDGNITYKDSEELDFIHKCMAMTAWDINVQPNLIGLPSKGPYAAADRAVAKAGASLDSLRALNPLAGAKGALPDLPCHLNAHNEYNAELIRSLNSNVWPEVKAARKDCKDTGKDIKKLLEDHSNHWKKWLNSRGGSYGGAAACWVNREEKSDVWYIPLSMDPNTPEEVDPPPNIYKRKASIRAWMADVFAAL